MRELKKVVARPRTSEQLPFAFEHRASSGRDDLLISERMAAAVAMIDNWPAWPSPVVIITGPGGSGKSHLADIWRQASGALSIHPLAGAGASEVAAASPVVFEDADRTGFDDTELFHVINSVKQNGQSLLMTARAWPLSWDVELADLKSRLRAATMVEIGEPDEGDLAQLIVKLFADRQLNIDDKIVDYIVPRMERSYGAVQAVVERIDTLALARRTKVTRSIASEVISALSDELAGDDLSQ